MAQLIAVSRTEHLGMFFDTQTRFQHLHDLTIAPMLMAEMAQLVPEYVLAFRKREERFELIALLGMQGNVYLSKKHQWLASYVPAVFRSYPFKLARQNEEKSVLCIRDDALSDKEGEPLFDDQGELAAPVNQLMEFLHKCDQNQQFTERAVDALQAADIIQPWPLRLKSEQHSDGIRINDIYAVDEKNLNKLEIDQLAELRKTGALAMAYGQLFSMVRVKQLQLRIDRHNAQTGENASLPDFEELFDGKDDSLSFS